MSRNSIPFTGRHGTPGEELSQANRSRTADEVYVGTIFRVHTESNSMDVLLQDMLHPLTDVPITMPGMGPMSAIGVMPEKGGVVILLRGYGSNMHYPIAYFPPDPTGGREYRILEKYRTEETDYSTEMDRLTPSKMRFMGEGDAIVASSGGSELYLDKEVELHDSHGNELRIRPGDGAVLSTSRNNYMFTNGVWRGAGLIQRNSLALKLDGKDREDIEATRVTLSDGQEVTYVGGQYLKYGDDLYTEYRIDVDDKVKLHHPLNDINSEDNYSERDPQTSFTLGNYVGNNPGDSATYGKFMAPRFIEGKFVHNGRLAFTPISRSGIECEYDSKGIAWSLERKGRSFLGSDKEGSMHRYMGAGRGTANGGWSLTSVAEGGRRELWGASADEGTSVNAEYLGGIKWLVGKNMNSIARGIFPWGVNIKSAGSTYIAHGDAQSDDTVLYELGSTKNKLGRSDMLDYAKIERVSGKSRLEIDSDYELQVGGDFLWSVGGSFGYKVAGAFGESVFGDRSINTTAAFAVNSTEVKTNSGSRTEKLTLGNDDKTLMLGNDATTIMVGQQTTSIATGGKSVTIGAGNYSTSMAAGNFSMSILAGNATLSTAAGSVSLTTAAGTAMVGGIATTVSGTATVNVQAPIVGMGLPATRSGVVTMMSHKCFITGLPPIPSMTVTAAM